MMAADLPGTLKQDVKDFLASIVAWAESVSTLQAIALVGSQARGDARSSSDIDLILLCKDPEHFLSHRAWISAFGEPHQIKEEHWGKVTSIRVFYRDGLEVEFGVTGLGWGADPTDHGDGLVIQDGLIVLYERDGHLTNKVKHFNLSSGSNLIPGAV
ncbi:MAG: nucleotidyltransferase domain-containing protein [Anaerolineales bacterium]|nr:MAG: nucleotidyltransferase domain-containing protein [Anaerolineales bacterium]